MAACGVRPFCNVYRFDSDELSSLSKSNMIMERTLIVNEEELLQPVKLPHADLREFGDMW